MSAENMLIRARNREARAAETAEPDVSHFDAAAMKDLHNIVGFVHLEFLRAAARMVSRAAADIRDTFPNKSNIEINEHVCKKFNAALNVFDMYVVTESNGVGRGSRFVARSLFDRSVEAK